MNVGTCVCEKTDAFTRPSGLVVCATCGGIVVPKKVPEVRP